MTGVGQYTNQLDNFALSFIVISNKQHEDIIQIHAYANNINNISAHVCFLICSFITAFALYICHGTFEQFAMVGI